MNNEPTIITTLKRGRSTGQAIGKAPIQRDMNMADAGKASSMAVEVFGRKTRITLMAVSESWHWNKNKKRLKSMISGSAREPGD